MCFLNKLLVFFVFVAIGACFYFSAITLKTHSVWRGWINELKVSLAEVEKSNHAFRFGAGTPPADSDIDYWLAPEAAEAVDAAPAAPAAPAEDAEGAEGTEPTDGTAEPVAVGTAPAAPGEPFVVGNFQPSNGYLQKALARIRAFRGYHSWFNCPTTTSGSGASIKVSVEIKDITEDVLPLGARVYGFEESEDKNSCKYMGLFFVESCGGGTVTLLPDPVAVKYKRMADNIKGSTGTWTIYEIMPADSHEAFLGENEEILRSTLPDKTEDEFVKDGQKNAEGIPYVRSLRAYEILFELYFVQDILLNDLILIEASDALSAEDNMKLAQRRQAIQEQVKASLTADKKRYDKEYSVIKDHTTATSKRLTDLEAKKKSYQKDIVRKAETIAKRDFEIYKNAAPVEAPR